MPYKSVSRNDKEKSRILDVLFDLLQKSSCFSFDRSMGTLLFRSVWILYVILWVWKKVFCNIYQTNDHDRFPPQNVRHTAHYRRRDKLQKTKHRAQSASKQNGAISFGCSDHDLKPANALQQPCIQPRAIICPIMVQ